MCIYKYIHVHRFAMKLLDKKRIKVKKGELLSLNERNMLAKVRHTWMGILKQYVIILSLSLFLSLSLSLSLDFTGQQSFCCQSLLCFPDTRKAMFYSWSDERWVCYSVCLFVILYGSSNLRLIWHVSLCIVFVYIILYLYLLFQ